MKLGVATALAWLSAGFVPVCGAAEIQLEHTYAEVGGGGSSWGTDDTLTSAMELSEDLLPPVFMTPLRRSAPESRTVRGARHLEGFYLQQGMLRLYRSIHFCVDSNLQLGTASFRTAFAEFARTVAGTPTGKLMVDFQWLTVDRLTLKGDSLSGCDVLIFQASEGEYPFDRFPASRAGLSLPEMVLGLFYQHSPKHLPVIAFSPLVNLDFSGKSNSYFDRGESGGRPRVDGRTLFLHELGHLLGFAHVTWEDSVTQNVETVSVMGLKNALRSPEQLALRFLHGADIWKSWDLRQTSFYRAQIARWLDGVDPGEDEALYRRITSSLAVCAYPGEELRLQLGELYTTSSLADALRRVSDRVVFLGAPREFLPNPQPLSARRSWRYVISPDFDLAVTQFGIEGDTPAFRVENLEFHSQAISEGDRGRRFIGSVSGRMESSAGETSFGWFPALRSRDYMIPLRLKFQFDVQSRMSDCYRR